MALYTIAVPDPPPGQDFEATVPGQYLWGVTGVTATLTTDPNLVVTDASGFGNNGTYDHVVKQSTPPPFGQVGAIPGDAALAYVGGAVAVFDQTFHGPALLGMDWSGDWSFEWWEKASSDTGDRFIVHFPGAKFIFIRQTGLAPTQLSIDMSARLIAGPHGSALTDGAWHHYVWSYVQAVPGNTRLYRDGVALTAPTVGGAGTPIPIANTDIFCLFPPSATFPAGWDEIAIYQQALSPAQVAAHYAARGDFTTYFPAVLADAPRLYYHLDEVGGVGGRQVCLIVTDGTRAVATIPSGLPNPDAGTTFQYSWQPSLGSRSFSAGAGLLSIPVPPLLLPSGYTLGSETLDLGPNDQWSNITVWWDSAIQDASGGFGSFAYPPGAHLVYHPPSAAH